MEVQEWDVERLIPYARNPRKNDDVVDQMAASIREFGFKIPVLAKSDGTVVDGHLRLKAASVLNLKTVPVILCDEWSDAQVKAFRLLVNRSATWAQWDEELLALEMQDLKEFDYDLSLTGFTEEEIGGFLELKEGDLTDTSGAIEKNPEAEALLDQAWVAWSYDVLRALECLKPIKQVSVGLSRSAAKIRFLQALYYGKFFPSVTSLAWNPHRTWVPGSHGGSILDLFGDNKKVNGKDYAFNLRFLALENPVWETFLHVGLAAADKRMPLDFPVALARELIDEFCTGAEGRILDPCHGWGGRPVGFLLSKQGKKYYGFDPSELTFAGVKRLAEDLLPYCPGKQIETYEECFEDVDLGPNRFDFAFTSPPYYDVETYTGNGNPTLRYKSFEEWNQGFYRVMIQNVAAHLEPGAAFAVQCGNQRYPMTEQAIVHGKAAGLRHQETRWAGMRNTFQPTPEEEGEQIVILRR